MASTQQTSNNADVAGSRPTRYTLEELGKEFKSYSQICTIAKSLGVKIRNGRDDIVRRILLEQEKATVPASTAHAQSTVQTAGAAPTAAVETPHTSLAEELVELKKQLDTATGDITVLRRDLQAATDKAASSEKTAADASSEAKAATAALMAIQAEWEQFQLAQQSEVAQAIAQVEAKWKKEATLSMQPSSQGPQRGRSLSRSSSRPRSRASSATPCPLPAQRPGKHPRQDDVEAADQDADPASPPKRLRVDDPASGLAICDSTQAGPSGSTNAAHVETERSGSVRLEDLAQEASKSNYLAPRPLPSVAHATSASPPPRAPVLDDCSLFSPPAESTGLQLDTSGNGQADYEFGPDGSAFSSTRSSFATNRAQRAPLNAPAPIDVAALASSAGFGPGTARRSSASPGLRIGHSISHERGSPITPRRSPIAGTDGHGRHRGVSRAPSTTSIAEDDEEATPRPSRPAQ